MTLKTPWSGDWRAVLHRGLERLGYTRVTELVRDRGGQVTFYELAHELGGKDLAPIQIGIAMRNEAQTDEDYLYFAKIVLISYLREMLPERDPRASDALHKLHPLIAWKSIISESYADQCDIVIRHLLNRPEYPNDWLPSGVDDPIVSVAFDGLSFPLPPELR